MDHVLITRRLTRLPSAAARPFVVLNSFGAYELEQAMERVKGLQVKPEDK